MNQEYRCYLNELFFYSERPGDINLISLTLSKFYLLEQDLYKPSNHTMMLTMMTLLYIIALLTSFLEMQATRSFVAISTEFCSAEIKYGSKFKNRHDETTFLYSKCEY